MRRRIRRCSDCGEQVTSGLIKYDAARVRHFYHPGCWALVEWWLLGHDDGQPPAKLLKRCNRLSHAFT